MTRRLILMRHAKSSWGDPQLPDHERPLNSRGRRAAHLLGDWLRAHAPLPDQALVSTSLRTRESWDGLGLGLLPELHEDLYHAEPPQLLDSLQRASGGVVLVLAHNPGIGLFAARLLREPPAHPRFADYPTGATLVAEFDIADWSALRPGTGRVVDFVVPRELET
ncbi:SixA phosphatase family protein [Oceanicola sp. S124]|uniref:SixA phosphatase family protein n=1 Tax=Oceanicola sp. S124 TaxID=1042378 RepID=UPI000255A68F|nr:histidine phosphatase family protein [Oceanicola sp. S124]